MSAVWTCPVCDRKVPIRVLECYCGVRKQQVVLPALARQARAEQEGGWKWSLLGWVTAGALLLALVVQDSWRRNEKAASETPVASLPPQPQPPPLKPVPVNVAHPPEDAASPAAAPRSTLMFGAPGTEPESPADSASPSPSATPTVVDDTRERGAQAYQASIAGAVSRVKALGGRIQEYAASCSNDRPSLYPVVGCDGLRQTLEHEQQQIARALDEADDLARRAWVEPGTQRQIRAQAQLDEAMAEVAAMLSALTAKP